MSGGPPMPPMPPGMKLPPMPPSFRGKGMPPMPPMPPGMKFPPQPPMPPRPPQQGQANAESGGQSYLRPYQQPPMPGDGAGVGMGGGGGGQPFYPPRHDDAPHQYGGMGMRDRMYGGTEEPYGQGERDFRRDDRDGYGRGGGGGRGFFRGGGGRGGRYDRYDRYDAPRGGRGGGGYRGGGGRGFDRGGRGGGRGFGGGLPPRDPTNTVWVGSLDPAVHTDQALREAFGEFGKVMQVARHDDRGYCFVHFRTVEEAKEAVDVLSHRMTLGAAIFNYGKMYEYSPEQMAEGYDPASRFLPPELPALREERAGARAEEFEGGRRRWREEGGGVGEPVPRRVRNEREPKEPSNILWVGSLPPFMTDSKLHDLFDVFGDITHISRMDRANIAFVHFDTVEHCTTALETMRGRQVEGGVELALNYGHPQRSAGPDGADGGEGGDGFGDGPNEQELDGETAASREVPTNVVYLGSLPADATDSDIDALFKPFEGYMSSKYVSASAIAFGHFVSSEHARTARVALHNTVLHGVPIRVNFGKHNHRQVPSSAEGGGFDLDAMMQRPPGGEGMDGVSGALVAGGFGGGGGGGGVLALPAMGAQQNGGGPGRGEATAAAMYARNRPAPEMTLDARLQSVVGATYNNVGATNLELSPSQIQAICSVVDTCVDEAGAQQLDHTLSLYCPQKAVHVMNLIAKRLHEYYRDDPHKRLLVLYSATCVLLGVHTPDYDKFSEAALNAYLMVLLVAGQGQTASGLDRVTTIVEGLEQSSFIGSKSNASEGYEGEFREQLQDILSRAKAEQDLNSLLKKKRRR